MDSSNLASFTLQHKRNLKNYGCSGAKSTVYWSYNRNPPQWLSNILNPTELQNEKNELNKICENATPCTPPPMIGAVIFLLSAVVTFFDNILFGTERGIQDWTILSWIAISMMVIGGLLAYILLRIRGKKMEQGRSVALEYVKTLNEKYQNRNITWLTKEHKERMPTGDGTNTKEGPTIYHIIIQHNTLLQSDVDGQTQIAVQMSTQQPQQQIQQPPIQQQPIQVIQQNNQQPGGYTNENKFCQNCGTKVTANDVKFCENCGKPL